MTQVGPRPEMLSHACVESQGQSRIVRPYNAIFEGRDGDPTGHALRNLLLVAGG